MPLPSDMGWTGWGSLFDKGFKLVLSQPPERTVRVWSQGVAISLWTLAFKQFSFYHTYQVLQGLGIPDFCLFPAFHRCYVYNSVSLVANGGNLAGFVNYPQPLRGNTTCRDTAH